MNHTDRFSRGFAFFEGNLSSTKNRNIGAIKNSTIGPGVSIGERTQIDNCQLKNCLIQNDSYLENLTLEKAMIGNQVHYKGNSTFVSVGDYSHLQ